MEGGIFGIGQFWKNFLAQFVNNFLKCCFPNSVHSFNLSNRNFTFVNKKGGAISNPALRELLLTNASLLRE